MKPLVRTLPIVLLLGLTSCVSAPQGMEWVIILVIALLLFGGAKLPSLMRSMGSGVHEFKKGLKEGEKDAREDEHKDEQKAKELKSGRE
ncbi:MAG: twin-arginine translocase TatA/TatE family subunit [Planctomycetota bacterium]|nr:MAG: twin-arginine translocase TatA/TatE family subunit [Planctomycetota bacterium]